MSTENEKYTEKFLAYKKLIGERLCPLCNKFFKNKGFTEHHRHCVERNGDWSKTEVILGPYICKFCGSNWGSRDARNGHQIKCHKNPKRESCITKISESCKGRTMTQETCEKISMSMKKYHETCKDLGNVIGKINIKDTAGETLELFFKDEL